MAVSELERCVMVANRMWQKTRAENRAAYISSDEKLRKLVARVPGIRKTIHGNFVAQSEPTYTSAMFTKSSVNPLFGADELRLLAQ